jgi:hypothetical protein
LVEASNGGTPDVLECHINSILKLETHFASMNYFNSDMSKITNTVVYSDWKTVIYIYVSGQCRTQFMPPDSSRQ